MYRIEIISAARKDLDDLEKNIFLQIKEKILSLADNPRQHGSLKLTGEEGYRLRAGDYRILYRIDDKSKVVFIYRIKHRREVYR
jgi:mRNA interferase RelE/StbE